MVFTASFRSIANQIVSLLWHTSGEENPPLGQTKLCKAVLNYSSSCLVGFANEKSTQMGCFHIIYTALIFPSAESKAGIGDSTKLHIVWASLTLYFFSETVDFLLIAYQGNSALITKTYYILKQLRHTPGTRK